MEGRWGRRIYGRIYRVGKYTFFRLYYTTSEGEVITSTVASSTAMLNRYPDRYRQTLDEVLYQLEKQLNRIKNTP